jgi:hypothetical protein
MSKSESQMELFHKKYKPKFSCYRPFNRMTKGPLPWQTLANYWLQPYSNSYPPPPCPALSLLQYVIYF